MNSYRRWCAGWMAAILLGLTACGGGGDPPTTTQTTVGAAGAHVVGAGGIVLDIPAGALGGSVDLKVTNAGDGLEPAVPDTFAPASGIYTITPHIEPFGAPVTVSIPAPGVADGAVIYMAIARPGEDWVLFPATVSGGMASATTYHFSYVMLTYWATYAQTWTGPLICSTGGNGGGGCPRPLQPNQFQLFSSVPLQLFNPARDRYTYLIDQQAMLTFLGTNSNDQSFFANCSAVRFYLRTRNWGYQGGVWTQKLLQETHQDVANVHNVTATFPVPVDASMNGWLLLEVAADCLVAPASGGALVPKYAKPNYFVLSGDWVQIPAAPPVIMQQPQAQSVVAGQSATFSVTATGAAPLSYQWFRNGMAIAGATDASYPVTNAQLTDSGSVFSVTVTDANGSTTSSGAVLTVAAGLQITQQPLSQSVGAGQSATFSVTATGTAPLSYQWSRDGQALTGADATAQSYTLPNVQPSDSGAVFTVAITDGSGATAFSSGATLTVTAPSSAPSCTGPNNTGWCSTPVNASLSYVAFGSASVGLAVEFPSSTQVLRTLDGGVTWTPQAALHQTQNFYAFGLAFADATTAILTGQDANTGADVILRSTDAGLTWSQVYTGPFGSLGGYLGKPVFAGRSLGLVPANGHLLRSTDAGATWSVVNLAAGQWLNELVVLPGGTVLGQGGSADGVLGATGAARLLRSVDGGLTWASWGPLTSGTLLQYLGSFSFVDNLTGVAAIRASGGGQSARLARTTDGGQTWTVSSISGAPDMFSGLVMAPDGTGLALDGSVVMRTTDSGSTWQPVNTGTSQAVVAGAVPSAGVFVLVGTVILRNTQGGAGP